MSDDIIVETRILDSRIGRDFPMTSYATDGSAGIDLLACVDEPLELLSQQTAIINTGIAISIVRPDVMALMAPRSGLGVKHGIVLANTVGIIDSDYQDEIRAALFNRSNEVYTISPGERICQLIFVPVVRATLQVVKSFSQNTGRGGFGSTGKF